MMRVVILVVASVVLQAGVAEACGVPGAGGPAGVAMCNLKDAKGAKPDRVGLRFSASFTQSDSVIVFPGRGNISIERSGTAISAEFSVKPNLILSVMGGAVVRGTIGKQGGDVTARVLPGPLAAVSLSWRVLGLKETEPLLLLSTTFSFVTHDTVLLDNSHSRYTAGDVRFGVICGKTLWDVFTPYAVARVFGGPVFYSAAGISGTDLYHFQLGAGATVSVARRVDFFFEAIALGERALTGGIGLTL